MKAIDLLKEYKSIDFGCNIEELHNDIDEAIKELEALTTTKQTTQSKFKVGDWVVYTGGGYCDGEILQITNIDERDFCSFGSYNKLYHFNKLKLWKPKSGEWCWVFDDKSQIPVLRKFLCTHDKEDSILPCMYIVEEHDRTNLHYRYIEPFIGALPSAIEQY